MRRLLLFATVAALAAVGASGQRPDACRADMASAMEKILALGSDGLEEHRALLAEIQRLKQRHANGPADCRSDLLVEEITLTNFVDEPAEAIRLSDRYLASDLARAFPSHRGFVLRVRGYAYEALGETVRGAQDYFAAAALARETQATYAIQALQDAAETAIALGRLDQADGYYRQGLGLLRDSLSGLPCYGLVRSRLLSARANLLVLHLEREGSASRGTAAAHRLRALAAEAAHGLAEHCEASFAVRSDLAEEALAWSAHAAASAHLGAFDEARQSLATAADRLAASGGINPDGGHTVWMRAASIFRSAGDREAAQGAARNARQAAQQAGSVRREAMALEMLATLDEENGALSDAEAHFRDALALREIQRERLKLQDWSVSAFAESQAPYRGLVRLLAGQNRAAEAFAILDRSRARHLREMRAHAALRARLSPAQRLQLDTLLTALEGERLAELRAATPDRIADATARISRLQADIRSLTPDAPASPSEIDLVALQAALGDGPRVLTSYYLDDDVGYVFLLRADTLLVRALPVAEPDVRRLVEAARGPWMQTPDPAVALGPLHALHEALIGPIRDDLPPGVALVVIPDRALADIPFSLLVERPAITFSDAPYLIRSRPVVSELAAALLLDDEMPSVRGVPAVDLASLGRSKFGEGAGTTRARSGTLLPDLPHVAHELRQIGRRVRHQTTALNARATEAAMRDALSQSRVVHIASHAETDPEFPLHARIHLWPSEDDDGVLHLYELQSGRAPCDLVVLSGCSTARGRYEGGEGTLGLHYGLRAAGARATMATLWSVDDRATADVMDRFYEALADGQPKDQALQTAQLGYLDAHEGLEASPYFWASFVMSGDVSPVALTPPRPFSPAIMVALACLIGGLAWSLFHLRRRARRPAASL